MQDKLLYSQLQILNYSSLLPTPITPIPITQASALLLMWCFYTFTNLCEGDITALQHSVGQRPCPADLLLSTPNTCLSIHISCFSIPLYPYCITTTSIQHTVNLLPSYIEHLQRDLSESVMNFRRLISSQDNQITTLVGLQPPFLKKRVFLATL